MSVSGPRSVSGSAPGAGPIRTEGPWVEAAPFRAHLRHLMAAGDLTAEEVALLAGLPPRFARSLLQGRRGRPLRRISPEQASRLLRLNPDDLTRVTRRRVVAALVVRPVRQLEAAGWAQDEIAGRLGLSCADLSDLLVGRLGACPQIVAVRAAAAAALLSEDPYGDDDDLPLDLAA